MSNRAFHRLLLEGVPVEYKVDEKVVYDNAFLIDFNGIPLAVLELKSPSAENVGIWDAYNQIQTYKDEIPELFVLDERRAAKELLKQDPVQADDRDTLWRLLGERESGGIIFTTVANIGLLSDEFLEDVKQMPYKNFAMKP